MIEQDPQLETPAGPSGALAVEIDREDHPPAGEDGLDETGTAADRRLVQRCVAGEVAAWEELYTQCHLPLLATINAMLGHGKSDPNVVDEIAARVWYALAANDGELLSRYDPQRGARLTTFFRIVAKDETSRYFRTERRRREREAVALRERKQGLTADITPPAASLGEFLATLTPHERGFCGDYLLSAPAGSGVQRQSSLSPTTIWQLTRRIHRKLMKFLDKEA